MNDDTKKRDRLSFYLDRVEGDDWVVKQGGVVVAGPYWYRTTAWKEMQRRIREARVER